VRVSNSPRAVSDLAAIGDCLAERNPAAAASVERRIRAVVDLIAQFPASGPILEERTDVRVIPLATTPTEFSIRYWLGN